MFEVRCFILSCVPISRWFFSILSKETSTSVAIIVRIFLEDTLSEEHLRRNFRRKPLDYLASERSQEKSSSLISPLDFLLEIQSAIIYLA